MAKGKYGWKTMCFIKNLRTWTTWKRKIDKIVWVPNNAFNDDSREIAALPGNLFEKELPFIGSLIDIVGEDEAIHFSNGLLEIVPVSIMRGRNFKTSCCSYNEAQNSQQKEHIKLLVGRCVEGSRIFFDGDIKQVDNYLKIRMVSNRYCIADSKYFLRFLVL